MPDVRRAAAPRARSVDPIAEEAAEVLGSGSVSTLNPAVAAGREMMDRAMRIVPARSELRVTNETGFVLHAYPYRETSLILDVFTRDHGRMAMVAKGAKRPHSALRAVLQHFHPISLSWTGRGEVKTLTKAEYVGGMLPLAGDALLSGFYLNELILRFCPREDAHPALFKHYMITLTRLAHGEAASLALRSFERVLLQETGFAVAFDQCANTGERVQPGRDYVYQPERGVRSAQGSDPSSWPVVSGQTLLDMAQDDYARAQTVSQSRALMRFLLHYYLQGEPLKTRQILMDLQYL
ncbi:DNA repair protein RecO [Cupriavidus pauculus]|jgi:DNA repair protein RecO (recombination protein O)|uniref:DNA repair protein RecO n=1 Tax=Cupriavidus pauculus TaxID=82633 RepID=UPI0007823928|nr:DNA repair protein RecO [Cupriavidus pauculus]KAB0600567.1 DNA repair protein RecO [Cupriavidus pauculus]MBY4730813.1 DNA repair protein RecO [Cupriavidus pauculus]MCM3609372.1 DNA repair protein RecO [Cupriavidus pauculus]UAL00114.1 DNA repair protein RecO [Cupriavidus pauculus]